MLCCSRESNTSELKSHHFFLAHVPMYESSSRSSFTVSRILCHNLITFRCASAKSQDDGKLSFIATLTFLLFFHL